MNTKRVGSFLAAAALAVAIVWSASGKGPIRAAEAAAGGCPAAAGLRFICGIDSPADLVRIGASPWVITSGAGPDGGLYLLNADRGVWKKEFPGEDVAEQLDSARFGGCSGAPAAAEVSLIGLGLRPAGNDRYTLYAANSARDSIEVFDVNAPVLPAFGGGAPTYSAPRLTWVGCVSLPQGAHPVGVTATRDGTIFASVPVRPGQKLAEALKGQATGAIYEWQPGSGAFRELQGTELPADSGVTLSADERTLYVAAAGAMSIEAFSLADPSHPLQTVHVQGFRPDSLHWDGNSLITAGMRTDSASECYRSWSGGAAAACHHGYMAARIDPRSMTVKVFDKGAGNPVYGDVDLVLPVGQHLWFASLHSDRIAYRPLR